jgi:alkanesulfonate monooxygenase SsuD/methylene tetrahydromethanopterin reductase-like flavin-dependent oxidoreductase (luciferase family)
VAGIGTFISVGRSLEKALERVRRADQLGFDSVYTTHTAGRDSLSVLMAYASVSERVKLGSGVMPIFSRTPVATAQAAATIDEFSGGRMVLGIGVSHQVTVENWFDSKIEKPVSQMREYAGAVRALLRREPAPDGKYFNTNFAFMGYEPRPDIPICIAGLSPNMLRLAGEIGDGVVLWLCGPAYIRDTVIPAVAEGRRRAGRGREGSELDGFDVIAAVPSALTDDRAAAYDTMRRDLITYASLPFYRAMLERSGFADEIAAFDAGMKSSDPDRALAGLSDRMLGELFAIGAADDVKAGVQRYLDAGATTAGVAAVPGTDFEATLESVAEML